MKEMIYSGDCRDVMKEMEPNSIDCVVTDPPYGIGFTGNAWDTFDQDYLKKDPTYSAERAGTYNQSVNANRQFQSWCHAWSDDAFRIAKPGTFMLVFGGTRTFHRMTSGLEDAGWEIRDCMMWLYGSGFPKSFNVAKAIDKSNGHNHKGLYANGRKKNGKCHICGKWFVSGTPCMCPRANEQLNSEAARQWSGWGTALKPAWEPIIVARKPLEGTVAQNVQKWGTGAMNIDGGRIAGIAGIPGNKKPSRVNSGITFNGGKERFDNHAAEFEPHTAGRWPANVILDEEAGAMLDGQTGVLQSSYVTKGSKGKLFGMPGHATEKKDDGLTGASRFFYCAKASKRERNAGLEGMPVSGIPQQYGLKDDGIHAAHKNQLRQNSHPTVKPISLLQYLIKLVCPPNGIVLDPFLGSGSTAMAAQGLGFRFIGIEKEEKYCEIAKARLGLVAA